MRRKKGERDLFGITQQPQTRREKPQLYSAITKLRASGFLVFRAGGDRHTVRRPGAPQRRPISTLELFALAERFNGWNPNA